MMNFANRLSFLKALLRSSEFHFSCISWFIVLAPFRCVDYNGMALSLYVAVEGL